MILLMKFAMCLQRPDFFVRTKQSGEEMRQGETPSEWGFPLDSFPYRPKKNYVFLWTLFLSGQKIGGIV